MAKRLLAGLFSLLLWFSLTGCAGFTYKNINELLRAPALGGGLDEIQKALTAYLDGVEPQYKYPKEGDWRSPLIQADLNGDGIEEAVLLYSVPDASSLYVYVALLEQVDGVWQVVQNVQGVSAEVASLEVADLLEDGTRQLIVGYSKSNFSAKTFALYTYTDGELERAFQRDYSRYEIGDFTGHGTTDLVVVSPTDELGGITLEYIAAKEGLFVTDNVPVLLDSNFQACSNIAPGLGAEGEHVLVVDGPIEEGRLFSQIVYYSGEHFFTVDDSHALRAASARWNHLLLSRDINSDGMVEIPLRDMEITTPNADKRLEFVCWMDFFTDPEGEVRQFGLLDSDRGLYISLPDDWRGNLVVSDGEGTGEWRLQDAQTRKVLLHLQVLDTGEAPPVGSLRVLGSANSYLVFSSGLTEAQEESIAMTLLG